MPETPSIDQALEESVRIGQVASMQVMLAWLLARDPRFQPDQIGEILHLVEAGIVAHPKTANDALASIAARDATTAVAELARALRRAWPGMKL